MRIRERERERERENVLCVFYFVPLWQLKKDEEEWGPYEINKKEIQRKWGKNDIIDVYMCINES